MNATDALDARRISDVYVLIMSQRCRAKSYVLILQPPQGKHVVLAQEALFLKCGTSIVERLLYQTRGKGVAQNHRSALAHSLYTVVQMRLEVGPRGGILLMLVPF